MPVCPSGFTSAFGVDHHRFRDEGWWSYHRSPRRSCGLRCSREWSDPGVPAGARVPGRKWHLDRTAGGSAAPSVRRRLPGEGRADAGDTRIPRPMQVRKGVVVTSAAQVVFHFPVRDDRVLLFSSGHREEHQVVDPAIACEVHERVQALAHIGDRRRPHEEHMCHTGHRRWPCRPIEEVECSRGDVVTQESRRASRSAASTFKPRASKHLNACRPTLPVAPVTRMRSPLESSSVMSSLGGWKVDSVYRRPGARRFTNCVRCRQARSLYPGQTTSAEGGFPMSLLSDDLYRRRGAGSGAPGGFCV